MTMIMSAHYLDRCILYSNYNDCVESKMFGMWKIVNVMFSLYIILLIAHTVENGFSIDLMLRMLQ